MNKPLLIISLTAASAILAFPAFSAERPHSYVSVTASKNNNSSEKGVKVPKTVATKKGNTITKSTYTGADTEGSEGITKNTTVTVNNRVIVEKDTSVVNTTVTPNGDKSVTKTKSMTGLHGNTVAKTTSLVKYD